MNQTEENILVYTDWQDLKHPQLMGTLRADRIRGKEIFDFEYHQDWLKSGVVSLDPDLQLYSGRQYLSETKTNFGLFTDSSPDRWGRVLMKRREAAIARKEERKPSQLFEVDFLLGVHDANRMGALRFKRSAEGNFLDDNDTMAAPPIAKLRELEHASLSIEKEDNIESAEYLAWLNLLLSPGSSLGGARPKANVVDTNNELWIAKFPSNADEKDIGAWEAVTYELAKRSGITMADSYAQKFSNKQHTFLTKRFDRIHQNRIHFASAMTLLGYTDGTDAQEGVSYLEIAEFIMQNGCNVEQDLQELWRRIVFGICVANTDDHLRNHGFILHQDGWKLSPAYDLNPNEYSMGLKLNINETDNALELDLAVEVAPYFRIPNTRVNAIIGEIRGVVKDWKNIATALHISRSEQELVSPAFIYER
jgi:serine/threonine-protein kinase HipA